MLMFVLFAIDGDLAYALLSLVSGVFCLGMCSPFVIDSWNDNKAIGLIAGFITLAVFLFGIWLVAPLAVGVLAFAVLVIIGYAGWKLGTRLAR